MPKTKTAHEYATAAHDWYAKAENFLDAGMNLDAAEAFAHAGAAASIATMLRVGAPKRAPRQRAAKSA